MESTENQSRDAHRLMRRAVQAARELYMQHSNGLDPKYIRVIHDPERGTCGVRIFRTDDDEKGARISKICPARDWNACHAEICGLMHEAAVRIMTNDNQETPPVVGCTASSETGELRVEAVYR